MDEIHKIFQMEVKQRTIAAKRAEEERKEQERADFEAAQLKSK